MAAHAAGPVGGAVVVVVGTVVVVDDDDGVVVRSWRAGAARSDPDDVHAATKATEPTSPAAFAHRTRP
jgi:hypothetical protein